MFACFHSIGAIDQDIDYKSVFVAASESTRNSFDGIRTDTYANRTSVITIQQYQAYCRTFNLPCALEPLNDLVIKGVSSGCNAIGLVEIQVQFYNLDVILYMQFLFVTDNNPTLISMKDMLDIGLYISKQGRFVSCRKRCVPFALKN